MLSLTDLHVYQRDAVQHAMLHPDSMLWLQQGLGKTIVALTAIVQRRPRKTLVLAPLRVAEAVWRQEARKWEHTRNLRFSMILGSKQDRKRALLMDADVYVMNYENLNWLAKELSDKPWPFDMVVYDEVTKLKQSTSMRMAGGKRDTTDPRTGESIVIKKIGWRKYIDKPKYRMGLTGTPASNGYKDLHGQFLVVDGGKRLGPYKTAFLQNYFTSDYNGWGYTVTDTGCECIEKRISDITIKMDAAEYLPYLPKSTTRDVYVDLPPKARKQYADMERLMFMELEDDTLEVFTKGSAALKCLQIANGAVYTNGPDEDQTWEAVHQSKLQALQDAVDEANGAPVLVAYSFHSDAERIMKKFKALRPVNLTDTPASQTSSVLKKWKAGQLPMLLGHPASVGHGLDGMQEGGSQVIWFGPTYNKEHYDQMNARLIRQGQQHPVTITRILAQGTVDDAVVQALANKELDERGLKAAVKGYRDGVSFL